MNIADCLAEKVKAGLVDRASAEKIKKLFDKAAEAHAEKMTMGRAERMAAERAAAALEEQVALRKRQAGLQAEAIERNVARVLGHEHGPSYGLLSILDKDLTGKDPMGNVQYRQKAIEARFHAQLDQALDQLRHKWFGFRQDRIGMRDTLRALYGETVQNPVAQAFADGFKRVFDESMGLYNAAGGNIKPRKDWGITHRHDRWAIAREGRTGWVDFTLPRIDWEAMRDPVSGLAPAPAARRAMLENIFETLSSGGYNQVEPGFPGTGKLANKWQDPRTLIFASADDWHAYDTRFGSGGDVFSTITGVMNARARDIALIEILGPNPEAAMKHLADTAKKERATKGTVSLLRRLPKPVASVESYGIQLAEATFLHLTGRADAAVNTRMGYWGAIVRNALTSAQLGSAAVSAVTDVGFIQSTALWNGIPAVKVLDAQARTFASAERRRHAVRLGLGADAWVDGMVAGGRYLDGIVGQTKGWSAWMADSVLRASGLTHWTQNNRWAFGAAYFGHLADISATGFDALEPAWRRALESVGVTKEMWARAGELVAESQVDGAPLRFVDVIAAGGSKDKAVRDLAGRLHELVLREVDFAVPQPTAMHRAALTAGTRTGTGSGEVLRASSMYKSFIVAVMTTHLARHAMDIAQQPRGASPYIRLAVLLGATTAMGAAAVQFKQMKDGKDPMDMTEAKFWGAALAQGGGLGLLGDFLYSGLTRHNFSLGEFVAGPVVAGITDLSRLTFGQARRAVDGTETSVGAELVRFVSRYAPGSNLWYAKLALERTVTNQLRLMADSRAFRAFRQMERKARQDADQAYWWRPGSRLPDRAPDLSATVGGSP